VLDEDDVKVILMSYRWQAHGRGMLVVKSTIAPIAKEIIDVNASHPSSSRLARFDSTCVRRPTLRVDPEATAP